MPTTDGTWRIGANGGDAARRWPALAPSLIASVLLIGSLAVFLMVRRTMGALSAPLPPWPLATTALVTLAWAWSVRAMWSRLAAGKPILSPKLDPLIVNWAPFVVLLLIAVACSFPGRRVIDWFVWLPAISAGWFGPPPSVFARTRLDVAPKPRPEPLAAEVLQQFSRFRAADGREAIHGTIVAEFAPGQQTASLHVAFCPPFERLPCVEGEPVDGQDAAVKVVQVLHNGARLDVQLTRVSESRLAVTVEVAATETSAP